MPSVHETRYILTARDKTAQQFNQANTRMQKLGKTATSLKSAFIGLAGAVGIGAMIKSTAESTRRTVAYSEALGVSIESLTQWQAAAKSVSLEADKVGDIMKDTSEKIGDAFRNDAGEAKEALESLGIAIDEIARMAPDQQLLIIADALDEVGTQGEKVQILESIANDASLLIPLLEDGAAGFKKMADQADRLGVTLDQVEADKILDADLAIRQFEASFEGLSQEITIFFAPAMLGAMDLLIDLAGTIDNVAQPAVDSLFDFLNPTDVLGGDLENAIERQTELVNQLAAAREMNVERVIPLIEAELDKQNLIVDALTRQGQIIRENREYSESLVQDVDPLESIRADELTALEQHEADKTRIVRTAAYYRSAFENKSLKDQSTQVFGELEARTRGVAQHNKALFEINKVAGIANAIISTHAGVTKTLETYPWPLAGVMAAIHLAAGVAQVAAISSTSFGSGGGAPSLAASGGTPANPVVQNIPSQAAATEAGSATIIIQGNVYSNDDFRLALIAALQEANELDELDNVRVING